MEALDDVYDRCGDRLYSFALQRLDDPAEAADVVDRTFAEARLRSVGLPADTALAPWLFGIGREVLGDHVRQQERLTALGPRRELDEVAAAVADRPPVDVALDELRAVDRDLLELHLWGWFDTDALASMFEVEPDEVGAMVDRIERQVQLEAGSAATVDWGAMAASRDVTPAPAFLRARVLGPTPVDRSVPAARSTPGSRRRPLLLAAAVLAAATVAVVALVMSGDERTASETADPSVATTTVTVTTEPPAPSTTGPSTTGAPPSTTVAPTTTTISPALAALEQLPAFPIDVP